MSSKRNLIETIIFCFVWIALFIVSFVAIYISGNEHTTNDLKSSIKIAQYIFNGNNPEETGQEVADAFVDSGVRISIIQKSSDDYSILYDSKDLLASDNSAIELDSDNLGKIVTRKSTYGYNMIYLAVRDQENPQYYIRAAINESQAVLIARNFLIYGSVVVVILTIFFILYRYHNYQKRIKPLTDQVQRLMFLSKLDPATIVDVNDLNILAKSIDLVSSSLDEKISDLETEKKKLRMILDSMPIGLVAISGEEKITFVNRYASKLFNYDEQNILNKDYHVLFIDQGYSDKIQRALEIKRDISPFTFTYHGRIYQVTIVSLPYSWSPNTPSGVISFLADVTEEKTLDKTKADFFANASHELKTPLTSVIGYLELVENDFISDPKEQKTAIQKAIKEAKKMRELLADMLTINQLENVDKKPVEDVDIEEIIENYLDILAPKIQEKKLTVHKSISSYIISANRLDMEKLFGNLIDNAVKYNKDNGEITIVLDETKHIFKISDTGIGIRQEQLPHIFERFYRVDNSRIKSNIEGTGLGLAIVKHICHSYGFQIEVSSTFGQGTSFTIILNK